MAGLILVDTAASQVGGSAIRHLLRKRRRIRGMIHSKNKAKAIGELGVETIVGDLLDPESIDDALKDVDCLFHLAPRHSKEVEMGLNSINAARRSGVHHFVYLSVMKVERKEIPHHKTKLKVETTLQHSGLNYTIIRPASFMQNILEVEEPVRRGLLPMPLKPENRISMVDVEDIGEVAATVMGEPNHFGKTYTLSDGTYTPLERAAILSYYLDREVHFKQVPIKEWIDRMKQRGLSEYDAHTLGKMWENYQREGYAEVSSDIEKILGRPPNSLESFIRKTVEEWNDNSNHHQYRTGTT